MKNASLILNVVLVLAVAVLFYLHFSSNKKSEAGKSSTPQIGIIPPGDSKIAYFEMDSIDNALLMVKDVRAELTKEQERVDGELAGLQKRYNDRLTQYQSQGQNLSSAESEKINREILQMRQSFSAKQEELEQKLRELQMRKRQQVNTAVMDFLNQYNKDKRFSYIFAYEPGFMFYKDSAYNITPDLIKGLNAQYKKP